MRFILGLTLLTGLAFGCGDDDGPIGPGTDAGPRDSGTRDSGGGGTDSGPDEDGGPDEDSGTPEDGGGVDSGGGGECPDLMPTGDEEVIIAKVDFASGTVELFNPGSSAVNVSTFQFCHRQATPAYRPAGMLGPATVEAGSYATYTMPESWFGSNTNGDFSIYRNGSFGSGENIVDYLCWGVPSMAGANRFTEADSADKWNGSCLTGPTMGAITRLASTSGTAAASYDTTSGFEATTCD